MLETKEFKKGKAGEGRISKWLNGRGYGVLPVYEIEGTEFKGPTVYVLDARFVAPDLLAFRKNDGSVRWVEAKTKSVFTWHRLTRRWTTGIDLKHYKDYLCLAEVSPWPIWLFFLHTQSRANEYPYQCPVGLFGGELGYLSRNENHQHNNWGRSGMVYWAHEKLKLIASLEDL